MGGGGGGGGLLRGGLPGLYLDSIFTLATFGTASIKSVSLENPKVAILHFRPKNFIYVDTKFPKAISLSG